MPLGWLDLVKSKFKSSSKFSAIGLKLCTGGVDCAVFKLIDTQLVCVSYTRFAYDGWRSELAVWAKQQHLEYTPCHVVLGVSLYQLLQVERPANIPDEELSQALRWSIKDLVSSDAEVAVDYFDLPVQTMGAVKVNVVASDYRMISDVAATLLSAHLELKSIAVEELAYCDFLPSSGEATALLMQEPSREICMSILKEGQVYFSRRLRGYEKLMSFSKEELAMGLIDNLALEVQRSMDYFESQLKQGPVRKISLKLDSHELPAICELIHQFTQVDTNVFELGVNIDQSLQDTIASHLALAAGLTGQLSS